MYKSLVLSSMESHGNLQKRRKALTRCYETSHWHAEWVNKSNWKTIESPPPSCFYPGYQRFFSRAAGIFGVGRRPKPRVSGTQGILFWAFIQKRQSSPSPSTARLLYFFPNLRRAGRYLADYKAEGFFCHLRGP